MKTETKTKVREMVKNEVEIGNDSPIISLTKKMIRIAIGEKPTFDWKHAQSEASAKYFRQGEWR